MGFLPPRARTVRWRPVDGEGLEHVDLHVADGLVRADGVVIGGRGGQGYGVRYRVVCGLDWVVRSLDLATTGGIALTLRSDGAGNWTDAGGMPLPQLRGCIDIDLAGSPLTNTLPIRRTPLAAGQSAEFAMAFVPFDTFMPFADGQRYTCLAADRLYRFAAVDGSFTADIAVDADGLVADRQLHRRYRRRRRRARRRLSGVVRESPEIGCHPARCRFHAPVPSDASGTCPPDLLPS